MFACHSFMIFSEKCFTNGDVVDKIRGELDYLKELVSKVYHSLTGDKVELEKALTDLSRNDILDGLYTIHDFVDKKADILDEGYYELETRQKITKLLGHLEITTHEFMITLSDGLFDVSKNINFRLKLRCK